MAPTDLDHLTGDGIFTTSSGYQAARLSRDQAPKGAVFMSEVQVMDLQKKKLLHVPLKNRWHFQFSQYISMGTSIVSSALINSHFRGKFQLGHYGALATLPVLLLPSFFSRFSDYFFTNKVLLLPECQNCLEVRSGVINSLAVTFPTCMLSPVVAVSISKKYHTYLSAKSFHPGLAHAMKTTPTHWMNLAIIAAINFGLAAYLRHSQRKEIDDVMVMENSSPLQDTLEKSL